jgi:cell shape-determining protein MreD
MIYGFYLFICLILIILQTTIFPSLPVLDSFFDLIVSFIIYLGLYRPVRESLPVVIVLGIIVDNLSGSPFMLYIIAYFWVYFSVRLLTRILQVGMRFRLPIIVVTGILLENLVFILTLTFFESGPQAPVFLAGAFMVQMLWAFFIGPILVLVYKYTQNLWDNWISEVMIRRSDMADRESIR